MITFIPKHYNNLKEIQNDAILLMIKCMQEEIQVCNMREKI